MSTLFLHGVPDTPHLWTPLLGALGLAAGYAPALPGFAGPPARGFDGTMDAQVDWVITQLEQRAQNGAVHVVGHDWGGLLVLRAAQLRPDLIKSWTILNASLRRDLKWHRLARIWQTPIKGEMAMLLMRGAGLKRSLTRAGMPPELLKVETRHIDKHMKRAILRLYRSAVDIGPKWGGDLSAIPAKGLIIGSDRDPFVPERLCHELGNRLGVPVHVLQGGGHWAFYDQTDKVAALLLRRWEQVSDQ